MQKTPYSVLQRTLTIFIITVIILLIFGLLFIYSASAALAYKKKADVFFYLKKQINGITLGIAVGLYIQLLSLKFIKKCASIALFGSVLLTSLTALSRFAVRINGASRWLSIAGMVIQPSELLKVGIVLYLAYLIEAESTQTKIFTKRNSLFCAAMAFMSFMLLRQPDFGLTVTLLLVTLMLLFIASKKPLRLALATTALLPIVACLMVSRPYRYKRLLTFLDPWSDQQGAGFQIIQSLIAIGSGGWFGVGIGCSKQKLFHLPMQYTDFIFSIIAEEIGFVGSICLILTYLTLLYTGIRLALLMQSIFSKFLIVGTVILINLQAILNIGVATGLLPTKGTGLPFLSYGNSGLICYLILIALVIRVTREEIKMQKSYVNLKSF